MSVDCSTCNTCASCEDEPIGLTTRRRVALIGNPNVGKTSVFNALTGLRQKVGNYPGVTVERKTGRINGAIPTEVIDLPGTYSLNPKSLDEEIACKVVTGQLTGEEEPDLVACVVDANNLERNLYLCLQLIELGKPLVIVLNMMDEAEKTGVIIDVKELARELGVPVIPVAAVYNRGIAQLRVALTGQLPEVTKTDARLSGAWTERLEPLAEMLSFSGEFDHSHPYRPVIDALSDDRVLHAWKERSPNFYDAVVETKKQIQADGIDVRSIDTKVRFDYLNDLTQRVVRYGEPRSSINWTDRIDRWLTHPVWGPIAFVFILFVVFQAVFAWATPAMDLIDLGTTSLIDWVRQTLPEGMWTDLLADGVIAGVGSVIIFLPQILLLFLFLGFLEDTGYMARAAFIADRLMARLGLSGRSVVPLVSGYACAVPAIMATRSIDNHKDRLVTMLVIPLMSCSARMPIYTLFIAAFIPAGSWMGILGYQGIALFSLYIFSTLITLVCAMVLKKYVIGGRRTLLALELPVYRRPQMRHVMWRMGERSLMFVTKAGKIIFIMSIVLWCLATFPRIDRDSLRANEIERIETQYADAVRAMTEYTSFTSESEQVKDVAASAVPVTAIETAQQIRDRQMADLENYLASEQVKQSFIGRIGHLIEPVMRPLGFDWKISAGIITAFAAREVLVSTLATIYAVGDADETSPDLQEKLRTDRYEKTGALVYSPLVAVSLMVFFALACQCMSTLAIARREMNSWKWPLFMFTYMTVLAYVVSLLVFQGGKWIGLG